MTRQALLNAMLPGVCCIILAGCGSSRLSHYPGFLERKNAMNGMTIVTDFIFIEGLIGDTDKVDLTENRELAANVLRRCEDSLKLRGYQIQKTLLTSVGLLMGPATVYKVARTVAEREASEEDLPAGSAPFYVDQTLNDTTRLRLAHVYNSLINVPQKEEGTTTIIPEAALLNSITDSSNTLMVLIAGGVNVPVSKGIGEKNSTPVMTHGVITVDRGSHFSIMLFVLDMKTGEVIWDDRKHVQGGVIYSEKIYSILGDLLEEFP
jgi:hypothetical protein